MTNAEKIYEDARVNDLTLQDVTDKICELYELDGVWIDPFQYTFKKDYSRMDYPTKEDAMEQFLVDTAHLRVKIVNILTLERFGYPVYSFTVEFHIIGGKMHKNWRQFIREHGKTAHRQKTTKSSKVYTVNGSPIGDVVAYWDSHQTMYKYRGIIQYRGEVHSSEYYSFEDAERYVTNQYYNLTQYSKFGDWLHSKSNEINMTQIQIGVYLGCSRVTVNRWINGQVLPDIVNFINLAKMIATKTNDEVDNVLIEMSHQIQ